MDDQWLWLKELRRVLKEDWANLWKTKHDDEVKAEGISVDDFDMLFVDQGEIIHATRDFKPLSFREILEKHVSPEDASKIDIDPKVGGWRKFAKENFPPRRQTIKRERPKQKVDLEQHQRKSGKGWLNKARIYKKIKLSKREY
ncbi:MAG: hypothetical protein NWF12_06420 [Candidatus Bathyarchaeota archaeon]|nr:hypothetical protein [Candidatus Bathyarchaeota archaeon]